MFGIGLAPSQQEENQYGNLTSAASFGTGLGESDLNTSSTFMQNILSGDSDKIAQALSPQIGNAKTSAQNQVKTTAEFGNRGGGTGAATASVNDKVHSDITALVGQLTGQSASTLASVGSNLFSTGTQATANAFNEANTLHQQKSAQIGDIFSSIASFAAAPFTGGASLGGLFKSSGSGGGNFGMDDSGMAADVG